MARTVLIVDDDLEFRTLASTVVAAWGFVIAAAVATSDEALVMARATCPDIALVDVGLPDGDGFALAQRLSILSPAPDIVLVSSDARAASDLSARRVGALGFVPKDEFTSDAMRRYLDGNADE